jgi:hypothetical protein
MELKSLADLYIPKLNGVYSDDPQFCGCLTVKLVLGNQALVGEGERPSFKWGCRIP